MGEKGGGVRPQYFLGQWYFVLKQWENVGSSILNNRLAPPPKYLTKCPPLILTALCDMRCLSVCIRTELLVSYTKRSALQAHYKNEVDRNRKEQNQIRFSFANFYLKNSGSILRLE